MPTYYNFQSPTNGTGTPSNPRNTFVFPPNDEEIFIRRLPNGSLWSSTTQAGGGSANNIKFGAYAFDDGRDDPSLPKPTITFNVPNVNAWNFQGDGVHVVRDLQFLNCSTAANGGVIGAGLVTGPTVFASVVVERCDFEGISHNAVRNPGSGIQGAPLQVVKFCKFRNIGEDAFFGGAFQFEFAYNDVENVSATTATGDGVGFIGVDPVLAWVHHNRIDHSSRPFKHCIIIDSATTHGGFALIEYNDLIGSSQGSGVDIVTVVNGDARMLVRGNRMRGWRVALNLAGNSSRAYSNLIYLEGFDGTIPGVALDANDCILTNNTIVGGNVQVATAAARTGAILRNNVSANGGTFYSRGSGGASETASNNAFQGTGVQYAGGASSAGGDITSGLLLDANYTPLRGSPLLTSGFDLGYLRDLEGKQGRKFIGAYAAARLRNALGQP